MDRDTKSSIWSCQIIAEKRIDKGAWKRSTNRNTDNCVYNWDCDRKKVKFATMNAVKFVTAHEVINIFDDQDTAQNYAKTLKLHDLQYPKSIVTFLVCNRQKTSIQPWYQSEMEAIRLMRKTEQTYLDESFCIFTKTHIENLKKLPTKEAS